jgi:hypothetical protein
VVYFDVVEALADGRHLDETSRCAEHSRTPGLAEESSACWQTDSTVLLGGGSEEEDPEIVEEAGDGLRLRPCGIAVYDLDKEQCNSSIYQDQPPGTLMPIGLDHAVAFYARRCLLWAPPPHIPW